MRNLRKGRSQLQNLPREKRVIFIYEYCITFFMISEYSDLSGTSRCFSFERNEIFNRASYDQLADRFRPIDEYIIKP